MGGPGAHPARCWAQTNPGRARCGPRGSGPASPPGRGIVGPSSSPPGPPEAPPPRRREMGTQKGNNSGGTRRGGAGGATATRETRLAQNTGALRGRPRRRPTGRPHARFPPGPPSRLHLAGSLLLGAGEVGDPGLFSLSFIFKPNTDPVTGWGSRRWRKGGHLCLPAGWSCGVQA